MRTIDLAIEKQGKAISGKLYGIFLEDINFACDGGLNANQVNNYSFDGIYWDPKSRQETPDPLRYWTFEGCSAESCRESALSANSAYARLAVRDGARIRNLGYNGGKEEKNSPAINIRKGSQYEFSCYIRGRLKGSVTIDVAVPGGAALTDTAALEVSAEWTQVHLTLNGIGTGYGALEFCVHGEGSLDLDLVSFMDADYWHAGDQKWTGGHFRRDLVEAIAALKPRFMRFPGGCIVEGRTRGNEYDWKDTVGPLQGRRAKYNLWSEKLPDGGYCQSYQIGFYEYFCLCEDLNMKPLPVLPAGICCQFRTVESLPVQSEDFRYEVQNYLDLIEFASGDPSEGKWAALRAEMGHPAPFDLEMIGVGNENFGPHYNRRFRVIEEAIHAKYPRMELVYAAGGTPIRPIIYPMWQFAKKNNAAGYLDEHSYNPPEWFIANAARYDNYARGTTQVYIGEYAANGMRLAKVAPPEDANRFCSALAEAAFLTGVERNGDVIGMISYAPLFNLISGTCWYHNMIDFCPAGISLTPNYLVQQLFSANCGDTYLEPKADLPQGVFASATTDGRKIWLKAVNTTGETFALRTASVGETVELQRLTAATDAKNTLTYCGEKQSRVLPEHCTLRTENGFVTAELPAGSVQLLVLQAD